MHAIIILLLFLFWNVLFVTLGTPTIIVLDIVTLWFIFTYYLKQYNTYMFLIKCLLFNYYTYFNW
jgi:hypothetical protein